MTAPLKENVVAPIAADKIVHKGEVISYESAKKKLGDGPMRFAPIDERSVEDQIAALSPSERECVDNLKTRWEKKSSGYAFSDSMYLRFARCSPGPEKFNEEAAWKVMKKFDSRYLTLTAVQQEKQLISKTLFVVPELKSKDGHDVFYMRPSRYFPKQTSTKEIIDNLAYCMQVMVEKEKACTEGIAFMANMADWSFSNFSVSYCHQFMMMLQGRVPVRVRLFLIVNPPSWFGKIWSIMKPMLAADFRKKVHMIPCSQLNDHLEDNFVDKLPDDIDIGKADTQAMVSDFVAYRKFVEEAM
uniref:CRAL-TRIO domain-containing protein n=1 Tax=Pseudictyota dubia TaxID=2749911 RepID=A0A6U2FXP7_9STRA|eukprot:CAMPEP_0197440226 /NCGR_PEP_ID=MMETSP1175-20131217/6785_1 /TAXON_ID=1003142 /ORGANISM="Triceratium dubium, Strain CCMP147" /LENGTH=299 /DNA_ID=CAMNT_0042970295 /DNA_START=24 /DNA_END=923 /DNA_ORIENTATION=+